MWFPDNFSRDLKRKVGILLAALSSKFTDVLSGFILTEIRTTDDLGILETGSRSMKGKSKARGKQRKTLQRPKYVFNWSSKRKSAYKDYFNPDYAVESQMLGLSDLVGSFMASLRRADSIGLRNRVSKIFAKVFPAPTSRMI